MICTLHSVDMKCMNLRRDLISISKIIPFLKNRYENNHIIFIFRKFYQISKSYFGCIGYVQSYRSLKEWKHHQYLKISYLFQLIETNFCTINTRFKDVWVFWIFLSSPDKVFDARNNYIMSNLVNKMQDFSKFLDFRLKIW